MYIKEAHPGSNKKAPDDGNTYNQPKSYEEREKNASACKAGLDLEIPFVVDDMENGLETAYAAWPDRIYIINKEGRIHFKGELGPSGFKPLAAEASLKKLL